MTTMAPARGGLRGWHVLVTLVTFFLIVTAVDGVMIYDALSTFSGNETEDAYRKGVAYNQLIKAEEAQNRLGWSQSNTFNSATGEFSVSFNDRDGHGIDGLQVAAEIGRPATEVFDRQIILNGAGNGRYHTRLAGLGEGTWFVSLTASEGDGARRSVAFRSKARLWKQP